MKLIKEISFKYEGWTSTNKIVSCRNIHVAKIMKDKQRGRFKNVFRTLIGDMKFDTKIYIEVIKRNRMDNDNTTLKYFQDALQDLKIIPKDDKRFIPKFSIEHSDILPSNSYIVRFYEFEENKELFIGKIFPEF